MRFALCLLALSLPVLAHHSVAAEFDDKKPVTVKGIVSKYDWTDPHVLIHVDEKDAAGNVTTWTFEFDEPALLKKAGWTRETLKDGDAVTVQGILARDGSKLAWGKSLAIAGGKKLSEATPAQTTTRTAQIAKPAPRWPDGHVRLGPEPGQTGYWTNPSASALIDSSAGNIKMNSDGLLANIADAGKVAPFQPWAKGLYEYRQSTLLRDDPMVSCLPPGGPRQFMVPHGVQIYEEPDRKRIFLMSNGANRNWRLIYLDGRAQPKGDDVTPTYFGYSAAKWEGDTLVVDVVGFNERFWFTNGGLPHTEGLHLTERISRPEYSTLKYEVTVEDPGAYTKPWSGGWTLQWVPADMEEYFCDDSNRDPAHMVGR